MRRLLLVMAVLVGSSATGFTSAWLLTEPPGRLQDETEPPGRLQDEVVSPFVVVQNHGVGSQGSGFWVDDVHVVTAYHVARGGQKIEVAGHSAKLVYCVREWDLAMLEVRGVPHQCVRVLRGGVELCEDCWYYGNRGGCGGLMEKSVVSHVSKASDNDPWDVLMTVNGLGWHGDSGCAVFVKRGGHYVVAGVLVCGLWVGEGKPPCGCIKASRLRAFLQGYDPDATPPSEVRQFFFPFHP